MEMMFVNPKLVHALTTSRLSVRHPRWLEMPS